MLALVNWGGGVHLIPLQAVYFKVIRAVHLKCRNQEKDSHEQVHI